MKAFNQIVKRDNSEYLYSDRKQEINRTGTALSPTHSRLQKRVEQRQLQRLDRKQPEIATNNMGYWILILLLFGKVTEVKSQIANERHSPEKSKIHAYKEIAKICTNKELSPYNKPSDIRLGAMNGIFLPASCVTSKSSLRCNKEAQSFKNFHFDFSATAARDREQVAKQVSKWDDEFFPRAKDIFHRLNSNHVSTPSEPYNKQSLIFKVVYDEIKLLIGFYFNARLAQKNEAGNCAEFTLVSLFELFKYQIENNFPLKMQIVRYSNSELEQQSQLTGDDNIFFDHQYLLIDSNVLDIEIRSDRRRATKFIQSIKEGKICDTWNSGHYSEFSADKTGLYNNNAHWDTIIVDTFSFYPKNLEKIPAEARRFLCDIFLETIKIKDTRPGFNPCFFAEQNKMAKDLETIEKMQSLNLG